MLILPAATRVSLLAALAQAHIEQADAKARAAQAATLTLRPARPIEIAIPAANAPSVSLPKSVHLKNGTRTNEHALPVVSL